MSGHFPRPCPPGSARLLWPRRPSLITAVAQVSSRNVIGPEHPTRRSPKMKRIGYSLLAVLAFAAPAAATVSPNGAHIVERVYNDCPSSTLVTVNTYPALISFTDTNLSCFGFANRHVWNFSSDGGATEQKFRNRDQFSFSAYVVIDGTGDGESGLRI